MKYVLSFLLLAFTLISCGESAEDAAPPANDQSALIEANFRAVYDALNSGNMDELDKYVAVDVIDHQMMPGYEQGLAGMKKMMTDLRVGYPDMKFTIEKLIVKGDEVVALFRMTGTNTGEMMGMPATNKAIDIQGADWVQVKDGKMVEHWGYMEEMKMMTQLGLMPGPGGHEGMPADGKPEATTEDGADKKSEKGM